MIENLNSYILIRTYHNFYKIIKGRVRTFRYYKVWQKHFADSFESAGIDLPPSSQYLAGDDGETSKSFGSFSDGSIVNLCCV